MIRIMIASILNVILPKKQHVTIFNTKLLVIPD